MGLDVTAMAGLVKLDPAPLDEYGGHDHSMDPHLWYAHPVSIREAEKDFPGRAAGIEPGATYRVEQKVWAWSSSYGAYNEWREGLRQMVGAPHGPHTGPFAELIYFSDCEGIIGPAVSLKLARDFAAHQPLADIHPNEWWREGYGKWRRAFELAAQGGAVDFH